MDGEMKLNGGGEPELLIRLSDPQATGNTTYRGFDMSGFLVPAYTTLEITRRSLHDSASSRTFILRDLMIETGSTEMPAVLLGRFDPAQDTLLLRLSSPKFSERNLTAFLKRIELIRDYHASALLLDSVLALGERIRTDSLPLLPYAFCDILELSKVTSLISGRNFSENLFPGQEDPLGIERKRSDAWKLSRRLAFTFQDVLAASGRIPPPAGMDTITAYFTNGLVRFIALSTMMGDHRGGVYDDYLERYYELSAFPDDRAMLDLLARKLWPEADPDTLASWISKSILHGYLDGSRKLIRQTRNADAQALLQHARLFCRKAPGMTDTTGIPALLEEASGGIYASYLGVAEAGIDYGKFSLAERYLQKAREYRSDNRLPEEGDTLYARVSGKLFRKRLSLCNWKISEGLYGEAIDCFCELESRLKDYVEAGIPDSSFQGRDGLQRAYHDIRLKVRRHALLDDLADHGGYIWQDKFDSADIYLAAFRQKLAGYGLSEDSTLLLAVREYEEKTVWKKCANALEESEILVVRASGNVEGKRYATALQQYKRAGEIADRHQGCGMKFPAVADSITRYRLPAGYQSGLDTVGFLYATGEFGKAVRLLDRLQDLYGKGSLQRFGLDSVSRDHFVREKNNPAFTLAVSRELLASGDLEGSLLYLKLLQEQGASPSMSTDLQSDLGFKMAETDNRSGIRQDCKTALLKYGMRDPWFKALVTAYCKSR